MVGLPEHFLEAFDITIESITFTCKTYSILNTSVQYIAIYLIIVFTVFRVVAVIWPHKANVYCTKKRAYISIVVTMCGCFAIRLDAINRVILFTTFGNNTETDCGFVGKRSTFYDIYFTWINLFVRALIPFFIIILCNTVIIYRIVKLRAARQNVLTASGTVASNESHSMTATLICISLLFLLTQTPFIVTTFIEKRMDYETYSYEYIEGLYVVETVFRLLQFVNNVANFFCYCISGRKFRRELISVILCQKFSKDKSVDVTESVSVISRGTQNTIV